jgi:uncharacterized membrane protein
MLQRLQLAAVISLLCLVGLIVIAEIWLLGAPVSRIWLLLTLLPLLLALRGFLHGRRYTFQWMSLVIWLYFAAGVVRTWVASSRPALVYGALEIILSLSLFALCCGYARYSGNLRQP